MLRSGTSGRRSMRYFKSGAAIVLILCATACASRGSSALHGPILTMGDQESPTAARHGRILTIGEQEALRDVQMDPARKISVQDCRNQFSSDGGNLRCN